MVPILLPGVDENTVPGYIGTTAFHIAGAVLVVIGSIGSDCVTLLMVMHIWPMTKILENTFNVINDAAKISKLRNSVEFKLYFRNAIKIYCDIKSYMTWLSHVYALQFWFEVNSNGISICMCLFCTMVVSKTKYIHITCSMSNNGI